MATAPSGSWLVASTQWSTNFILSRDAGPKLALCPTLTLPLVKAAASFLAQHWAGLPASEAPRTQRWDVQRGQGAAHASSEMLLAAAQPKPALHFRSRLRIYSKQIPTIQPEQTWIYIFEKNKNNGSLPCKPTRCQVRKTIFFFFILSW